MREILHGLSSFSRYQAGTKTPEPCGHQGMGFWEWFLPGQRGPASEGGGQGLYGIYTTDATSTLIAGEAAFLAKRGGRAVAPCNASAHAAPAAAADCARTWVDGLPGTGCALLLLNLNLNLEIKPNLNKIKR